ncbi:hypothetical protein AAT17_04545 [Nonlabens sp. MIC269]|uniref:hypothetical protein n=1 Tax=Nonlabens sp. MIC269 TaxID=1476901 RepID=UPI00071EB8B1|nr:hypothetical protein [Nonlabens sp. MIC269]ALM20555.1 hypothetical protein AAT17_04545 [Nonlabens sp. MIC269]
MDSELNLREIKKIVSSIILTIGICGLLYSLPSFQHPMWRKFMGVSVYLIFSAIISILGLISKIIIYKKYSNKRRPNLRWKKSIHLSIISLTLFLSLFIFTNPTPGYAPHTFAYNILYSAPVFWTSFGFSVTGLIMFFKTDTKTRKNIKWIFKLMPITSITPLIIILIRNIEYW